MNSNFLRKSKYLLLNFLKEPGGFSFFPSLFFWTKFLKEIDVKNAFKNYFSSDYFDLRDENNKINLYIHIPFCTKICSYCNCFKRKLNNSYEIDTYLDYLEKEIILITKNNNLNKIKINSIFIGGGTPNLLSIKQFKKLYTIITKYFDLNNLEDFLLDGHPNYYNCEKINFLKKIGITRITYAIQTFDKNVLKINNRDIYNIKDIKKNIKYTKKLGIKINIDLLIGMKGQSFDIIKKDINFLKKLNIDNVSIHYLMKSNNINYKLDVNYLEIITETKKYLLNVKLPISCSNKLEDYYVSKRNSTISIGASAITNIYSEVIYSKPGINDYYKSLNDGILPLYKGIKISKNDEMVKYIYLNILYGVNINTFKELFGEDIFKIFIGEFKFLNLNNIISIKNNIIYSIKNDLETLTYFNIFFLEKISDFYLNSYNATELNNFFLPSGDLIDK